MNLPSPNLLVQHPQSPQLTPIEKRQGANLPHWLLEGGSYFVTFRLADSLPTGVVAAWKRERDMIMQGTIGGTPMPLADARRLQELFSERIEKFLDAGAGECGMNRNDIAQLIANALLHFDANRYHLLAWCIMPNYVHVVFRSLPTYDLSAIHHSWKSFTAKQANKLLARTGPFWQAESYDHLEIPNTNQSMLLRRYNGKSHEHTNPLEGDTIYGFHIHQATERYQDSSHKAETYAEITNRYADFDTAVRCMINDCGFELPPGDQASFVFESEK